MDNKEREAIVSRNMYKHERIMEHMELNGVDMQYWRPVYESLIVTRGKRKGCFKRAKPNGDAGIIGESWNHLQKDRSAAVFNLTAYYSVGGLMYSIMCSNRDDAKELYEATQNAFVNVIQEESE